MGLRMLSVKKTVLKMRFPVQLDGTFRNRHKVSRGNLFAGKLALGKETSRSLFAAWKTTTVTFAGAVHWPTDVGVHHELQAVAMVWVRQFLQKCR